MRYEFLNFNFKFTLMFGTEKYPIHHNGNIQSLERKGEQEISNYALLIDNLEYSYQTNSNKLLNIKDLTGLSFGYHDQHTSSRTPDFEYDDFGNLIKDRDKKIDAIVYNHSNLPLKITFDGGEVIEYVYLSDGTKFKKPLIPIALPPLQTMWMDFNTPMEYWIFSLTQKAM